eukprot:CAMPEP_0201591984 /NCGR_PEP_ID=MMETSP0190_2-20130828/190002_1 /ASSEMBLY_ACC=CAM_ASM_000263 /TAXON_ID=37353 /ORGANISM="Rosalina sp." /LENGTH=1019 /DNA_ID=CAMNT_0048050547 /DNA_START=33 /DNA_END=3093 /DNA_ORIENTATION=-
MATALSLLISTISVITGSDEQIPLNKDFNWGDTLPHAVDIYSSCDPTPNSEIHVNNGLYYIKPLANGPVIAAICSNGYTMIDPSLDLNMKSFPSLLSSWDYGKLSTIFIMTNYDDTSTFREWWLPSTKNTKFRVADLCDTCQQADDQKNMEDNVVYYSEGSNFCYTWYTYGNACALKVNDYSCNQCDVGTFLTDDDGNEYWSTCDALQMSADAPSWHDPDQRVNHHLVYRPVMSMRRDSCTCYQNTDEIPMKYSIHTNELPLVTKAARYDAKTVLDFVDYVDPLIMFEDDYEDQEESVDDEACENNIHYLSQNDFLYGTYRIQECGEYIFTEDIILNFNAPTEEEENAPDFSPNDINGDRLYWFPTEQQMDQYPGLFSYEGSYSLGFFAGITVECDDVVINLNGFKYEMDKRFYLQQRFFSLIGIQECGEYIFTEDIILNFNAPTEEEENAPDFSPNSITGDRLYWFPTEQQMDQYPGLFSYEGSYSLGFFAGITVECDDVVINLNGFKYEMDKRFYLQQRFFSLIEMATKPFLPHQGASTWGLTDIFYPDNVEIKGPGTLGRTSHHGIHSNHGTNVYIHDLDIKDFDVAGIGCNACKYTTIENIVVGPQNSDIPTLGRFTHSRAFIPRLKDLNKLHGDKELTFYGRETQTVSELCQRMVNQMDMIYNNYINGQEYDEDDKEWAAAKKLYKNPTGWMDGGTSYGISINGEGAAVVGIGTRTANTNNIVMSNVEVFGIYNQMQEKIKFTVGIYTSRGILFDVTDWIGLVDQYEDKITTKYIGDVYTDVQFAANKYMESWYYRNSLYIHPIEESFVFNGNTKENGYPFKTIFPDPDTGVQIGGCGTDIQLHSSKGAIGIMINGAQESQFNNIYVHDVYNWADLGLDVCGEYMGPHLTQEDIDISYGYTGTRAHGMVVDYVSGDYKDIKIENVESWHGEANGLTIYKESYINLQSVLIRNVNAGTKLDKETAEQLVLPNLVPRACAVDIHDDTVVTFVDGEDIDNIRFENVLGYETLNNSKI